MMTTSAHRSPPCATQSEIAAQPDIWEAWGATLASDLAGHRAWIAECAPDEIWLCGAGTSAFVGDLIAAGLGGRTDIPVRSIPTTDLVSAPHVFARPGLRPLVISFGRSGNSAESVGTLDVLDALMPQAARLNITCNDQSALATRPARTGAQRVICLPAETHDSGFAMTSSYSTMLLTALSILDPATPADALATLAGTARKLLPQFIAWAEAQPLAGRIVFAGSGALTFAAREAALKVMELTAGQIPALWESCLGFRHGPKSFVTNDTLSVIFQSSDAYSARYDRDLSAELAVQFPQARLVTLGPDQDASLRIETGLPDRWNGVLYVLCAQLLGVAWSQRLGLNVDNPFEGLGTLTRVVSGVTLYDPTTATPGGTHGV
jgi:D-galactosamine 6-phosphate deaminase/isomerase